MRVLFIGGTGNISAACTRLAVARGIELHLLTRGQRPVETPGARTIVADVSDEAATARALAGRTFDAVVDFIAFDVPEVERDLRLFAGKCGQYVFVSSASCYRKPWLRPITEDVPLENPWWDYSRRKIACEERLARASAEGVPVTIVRPSLTYDTVIPLPIGGWTQWTTVDRMLRGKPVVVHGDGVSPWTVTHAEDLAVGLVGLLGARGAIGEAFHITGSELLTWDDIHRLVGAAVGVEPKLVHVASEDVAAAMPDRAGSLLGDKAHAMSFDDSKLGRVVPEFRQAIPFAEGIRRTVAWFQADPRRTIVDAEMDARIDRLLAAHARFREAGR
jgi:nucleoside-diphosphate-sugar epimerase